jgi:hypothetical protein
MSRRPPAASLTHVVLTGRVMASLPPGLDTEEH